MVPLCESTQAAIAGHALCVQCRLQTKPRLLGEQAGLVSLEQPRGGLCQAHQQVVKNRALVAEAGQGQQDIADLLHPNTAGVQLLL